MSWSGPSTSTQSLAMPGPVKVSAWPLRPFKLTGASDEVLKPMISLKLSQVTSSWTFGLKEGASK